MRVRKVEREVTYFFAITYQYVACVLDPRVVQTQVFPLAQKRSLHVAARKQPEFCGRSSYHDRISRDHIDAAGWL